MSVAFAIANTDARASCDNWDLSESVHTGNSQLNDSLWKTLSFVGGAADITILCRCDKRLFVISSGRMTMALT